VSQDLVNFKAQQYRAQTALPSYSDPELNLPSTVKAIRLRSQRHQASSGVFELNNVQISFSTCAVTISAPNFGPSEGILHLAGSPAGEFVVYDFVQPRLLTADFDESVVECHPTRSAILEMRPTRTSLDVMAREELSEFDREYPW
jgi:hypothetical protein